MFLFSLQFSATLINLSQNGQFFYENQAPKVNLHKMVKYFTTIVGQSDDCGTAIDFHVSHTAGPVATEGFGVLIPPNNAPSPPNWNLETINE